MRIFPKADGVIGPDDVGYRLVPPFTFDVVPSREARDMRARMRPRYEFGVNTRPKYRISAEALPRR